MKLFKTSVNSSKLINEMREKLSESGTKISIVAMTQIAFALSLRKNKGLLFKNDSHTEEDINDDLVSEEDISDDGDLGSIKKDSKQNKILDIHFLGENEAFYRTIMNVVYNTELTDDDFFGYHSFIKYHTDLGVSMLNDIFEECNKDPELFKDKLIEIAGSDD